MSLLLDVQTTVLFVEFNGSIEAINFSLPPSAIFNDVLFKVIPVTDIVLGSTTTEHAAVLLPNSETAVIVALPALFAVILPFCSTETIDASFDSHLTFLLEAFVGSTT